MTLKYNKNYVDNKKHVMMFLEKHKNETLTKDEQVELTRLCNIPNCNESRVKSSISVISKYVNDNFKEYNVISKPIFYSDKPMNRRWIVTYSKETT